MSTREAILDFLQEHPYSCADELSQVLLQTRANIQYHLKRLEREKKIVPIRFLAPGARGRPKSYYALAPQDRPDDIEGLAKILLEILLREDPQPSARINTIAGRILHLNPRASSLTQRLNHLVKALSERGYQARWEAHAGGPQVVFRNCPYATLLPDFPELCQVDASLLFINLGMNAVQKNRIHLPEVHACRFMLK